MIIYKATNIINKRSYIGQTSYELELRIKSHLNEGARDNLPFHNALLKYIKFFEWTVLEVCQSKEEMDEMEFHFIKQYDTLFPNGYNLTLGGEGNLGWKPTKETKKNISNKKKEWWKNQSKEYKKKYGKKIKERMMGNIPWNKGLTKKDHLSLQKISESSYKYAKLNNNLPNRTGCKLSEEHKDKIRKGKYGNKNGWHLSKIKKDQLERKSNHLYEIQDINKNTWTIKVLSVWCRENNIDYEKFRSYVNRNVYKFGYKVKRI